MKKLLLSITALLTVCMMADAKKTKSCMDQTRTVYASQYGVILDSDVYAGGGTDQTAKLQEILDKAQQWGRLHLVLDGAALISKSLLVHSNTTIECPDKSCGVFLADGSDCSCITNSNPNISELNTRNVTLIGGVYNNNSPGQKHHRDQPRKDYIFSTWVFGIEFYGIENLTLKGVTIANQRTFAFNICNWKNVTIEDVHIDRRVRTDLQNQDGLHFFGPGEHLVMHNVYGNSGDDFIAISPDEHDEKSSIKDVLIDGVWLDDADQGIRILCRGEGTLDQVVIRNVTGTYKSFGFIINPWFESKTGGNYKNIVFDNVDLHPLQPNYTYMNPFLFKVGGNIESLTLRNIYLHNPENLHQFVNIGTHYMRSFAEPVGNPTHIKRLIVDGLYVNEKEVSPESYINVVGGEVDLIAVDKVIIRRDGENAPKGTLIKVEEGAKVGEVITGGMISIPCLEGLQK